MGALPPVMREAGHNPGQKGEITMLFTVYASRADEVQKNLDRLAKKAAGYDVPFTYSKGEEHPQKVRVTAVGPTCREQETITTYTVAAVDFEIDCEQLIKANGWTVRAKIEHGENGNIVSCFGGWQAGTEWYTAPARCDHCGTNRFRSVTFICENEAGELKQVGRTCLKDYTGISPATAAMWAEVTDICNEGFDCTEEEFVGRGMTRMYETTLLLAHACDAIKEFGYRKTDASDSTRDQVMRRVIEGKEPSAEGMEKAEKIVGWLLELSEKAAVRDAELKVLYDAAFGHDEDYREEWVVDEEARKAYLEKRREFAWCWDSVGDIERNCIPLVKSGYAKPKHVGRLAYMPVDYDKYLERKAQEEQREADRTSAAASSSYVGEIGKRLEVETVSAALVTSWENDWGVTFLYKFFDASGNVFVWYASRSIDICDAMKIKGTVKDHSEYNGVKQTVLTRCYVM